MMEKELCFSPREFVIISERRRVARAPVSLLCKLHHRGILLVWLAGAGLLLEAHGATSAVQRTQASQGPEVSEKRRLQVQEFPGQQKRPNVFYDIPLSKGWIFTLAKAF